MGRGVDHRRSKANRARLTSGLGWRRMNCRQNDDRTTRPWMRRFGSSTRLVPIDRHYLESIATDSDRVPRLYYSRFRAVRTFFWMRLSRCLEHLADLSPRRCTVLDFGGGGGVFLPTLCRYFERVTCVDLEDIEARHIAAKFQLENVKLIRSDVTVAEPVDAPFDSIVAADVLEHFSDLSIAVRAIDRWLAPDGLLVTSLPVEDRLYSLLRSLFRVERPWDHYHTARQVEAYLESQGFEALRRRYVPFPVRVPSIYFVTAWRRR